MRRKSRVDYLRDTLQIYRMEIDGGRDIEQADKDAIRAIKKWHDKQMKPDLPEPKEYSDAMLEDRMSGMLDIPVMCVCSKCGDNHYIVKRRK